MRFATVLVVPLLTLGAASAFAHTHLQNAMPADGSVLNASPAQIVLTFSEATRLTALVLSKEGVQAGQRLEPLPDTAAARISVPAPVLAPGKYVVNWRAIGSDKHVMSGKLSFTVDPAQTASGSEKQSSGTQEHHH